MFCRKLYSKTSYIYIIIILYLIQESHCMNKKNKLKLLLNYNTILLTVKGPETTSILYSYFSIMPSAVYLNDTTTTTSSTIYLPNSINYVKLVFSSILTSCSSMFKGCTEILEIDLTDFISSSVQNINNMFYDCTSLKSIKFENFQTSQVNYMLYTFYNCESLEYLDLSSFITTNVGDFHYMFYGCKSLKYLNLSNFITSTCYCTYYMFHGCIS